MRNRLFAALSGLMILSMLLSACAPAATPAPTAVPATQAPAQPAQPTQPPPPTNTPVPTKPPAPTATPKPKVVRITISQEPDSLNPLYTKCGSRRSCWILPGHWPADVQRKERADPLDRQRDPHRGRTAASRPTARPSPTSCATMSSGRDGQPLTADDYVFTWQMIMSDKNAVQSRDPFDTYVDKVEAKDKTTLVVTFKEPYAPWQAKIFSNVNQTNAIPKHILEPVFQKDGTIDNAEWNRKPDGGRGAVRVQGMAIGQPPDLCGQPQLLAGQAQGGPDLYQDRARRRRRRLRRSRPATPTSAPSSPTPTCPTCRSSARSTWSRCIRLPGVAGSLT